jgi:hypothetical protein
MSTMPSPQIDPIEAWNNLVEWADDAEYDALEAMSDEELDAKLAAIGHNDPLAGDDVAPAPVSGVNLAADASGSQVAVATAAEPMNVVPFGPRRRRKILGLSPLTLAGYAAAAAAATTVGVFAARALLVPQTPGPKPEERPAPSAVPETLPEPSTPLVATQLRDEAREACAREEWRLCLGKLDHAKDIDPAGDAAPGVTSLRQAAGAGLDRVRSQDEGKTRKR